VKEAGQTTGLPGKRRGCLATGGGLVVLAVASPPALIVRWWRTWRRGNDLNSALEETALATSGGEVLRRLDLTLDVPRAAEPGFRGRLVASLVGVADALRRPDDVYHYAYRLPWADEPVVLPVGPQLQELGDRLSLVFSQGSLAARTVVWLTLGRDLALAEVVNPLAYDPEAEGEPEALLVGSGARWAMATSWDRVGPSLVVRVIVYVPEQAGAEVKALLAGLC